MKQSSASEPSVTNGTFEYIEANIRRDAEGTSYGGDFEWLIQVQDSEPL